MEMNQVKDSRWFEVDSVPENYIFSHEERPQNVDVPVFDSLPVIDLTKSTAVEAILTASKQFGFFQVINHGVPKKITNDAMNVLKNFFDMPPKEETEDVSDTKNWIYSSTSKPKGGVRAWRENLKHVCHPLKECIQLLPKKPVGYQEAIGDYMLELQKLSSRILEMICEGLGLEPCYFKDTSEFQIFSSNFIPPCPNPSLTLGVPPHKDPSLVTIVYSGNSSGLQYLEDGEWIGVNVVPDSFVVNIGYQLEIISNGKFKSVDHRVVTSIDKPRISIATSVNPCFDYVIKPAKVLVNESDPPRYESQQYKDFVSGNNAFGPHTFMLQIALASIN